MGLFKRGRDVGADLPSLSGMAPAYCHGGSLYRAATRQCGLAPVKAGGSRTRADCAGSHQEW